MNLQYRCINSSSLHTEKYYMRFLLIRIRNSWLIGPGLKLKFYLNSTLHFLGSLTIHMSSAKSIGCTFLEIWVPHTDGFLKFVDNLSPQECCPLVVVTTFLFADVFKSRGSHVNDLFVVDLLVVQSFIRLIVFLVYLPASLLNLRHAIALILAPVLLLRSSKKKV